MNKKERRLALMTLLSMKAKSKQIKVIELVAAEDAKTKQIGVIMENMKISTALFAMMPNDRNLFLASRNLSNVKPI